MTDTGDGDPSSSRLIAVHELERIESGGAYVGLSRRGKERDSAGEGKLTDLVSGVTRWRRRLDHLIDHFYSGKAAGLELRIRIILRIGLYELLMTREPDHAVVNEAVQSARRLVGKRATGLVNGILRSAARQREQLPEPDDESDADRLGILYSHPSWMVERWLNRFGEEQTRRLMAHNNERPTFGLRLRGIEPTALQKRLEQAGSQAEPSKYLDDFVRTQALQPVFREGLIERGDVLVQDEAAGAVVRAMSPGPGERILDTCAAPGGKSLYMADLVGPLGEVISVDRHETRLGLLKAEAERLGLSNIQTHVADFVSLNPDSLGDLFDGVLVDAPCSGLGVLSKRSDLRWRADPKEMAALRTLQGKLLRQASRFVKPGGRIVYSTCTIEPEENEEVVQVFIKENDHYALQPIDYDRINVLIDHNGMLRALPHLHGIDGAFAAVIVRMK